MSSRVEAVPSGAAPRSAPARWPALPRAVGIAAVVAAVVVQLLPVLLFPTVLTQDGPAHVASAWVLLHHGDGDATGALLREHYRTDLSPVPNLLATGLLALFTAVVGPDGAERLLVGLLVVGLVAALGWALRAFSPPAGALVALAPALAGSHLVVYGFYNYVLGVIGFLLVTGLALRRSAGWSAGATAGLAGLLLVTWTAHLLPFLAALAVVLVLGGTRTLAGRRTGTTARRAAREHLGPVVLAAVPAVVLTVVYLRSGDGPSDGPDGAPNTERLVELVAGVRPFVVWGGGELVASAVVTTALVLLALASCRRTGRLPWARAPERTALAVCLAGAVVVYGLTPARLGADFGFLVDRMAWFPPLLLVLWVAARPPRRSVTGALAAVVLLAATASALVRLPEQAAVARDVQELLSVAEDIRPASTLLVLQYDQPAPVDPGEPDPLRHASSRLAVRVGGVDVGHYEARQRYFQVSFSGGPFLRARLDPSGRGLVRFPPDVDLAAVRGDLDYVLVVGLDGAGSAVRDAPETAAVRAELERSYRQVATSAPTGLVSVWEAVR